MDGKVLWFEKTYGFLAPDLSSEEVFFHWSEIRCNDNFKKLSPGDRVSFDIVKEKKMDGGEKLRAVNIEIITRLSSLGKPLLRISFINRTNNLSVHYFDTYITSKFKAGLRFINITDDKIMATDCPMSVLDIEVLSGILKAEKLSSKIFYTGEGFRFDLNLV